MGNFGKESPKKQSCEIISKSIYHKPIFFFFFFFFFFVFFFFFFLYFCIKSSIGTRVELAGRKSALKPSVVYSTERSKAVVTVLVLLFVALWFILRGDLL